MKAARGWLMAGMVLAALSPTASYGQGAGAPPAEEAAPASPWSWLQMPKITMPKVTMPKMPADPLAPIKSSARKVGDGAKRAWEGTKELFTFGGGKTAEQPTERVASRPDQPSVWQRVFGGAEEEPQGPQTVADWMAQKRVE